MTNVEISKWLINLKADIGQTQYQPLWHYAEALDMAIAALGKDTNVPNIDIISRRAAIDVIRKIKAISGTSDDEILLIDKAEAMTELMMMPPAQPEIIRCGECMHKDKKIDYCHYLGIIICESDYCSYAERRTDE